MSANTLWCEGALACLQTLFRGCRGSRSPWQRAPVHATCDGRACAQRAGLCAYIPVAEERIGFAKRGGGVAANLLDARVKAQLGEVLLKRSVSGVVPVLATLGIEWEFTEHCDNDLVMVVNLPEAPLPETQPHDSQFSCHIRKFHSLSDFCVGECFVFDRRVGLGPDLEETASILCYECREPLLPDEQKSDNYIVGTSCPYCAP